MCQITVRLVAPTARLERSIPTLKCQCIKSQSLFRTLCIRDAFPSVWRPKRSSDVDVSSSKSTVRDSFSTFPRAISTQYSFVSAQRALNDLYQYLCIRYRRNCTLCRALLRCFKLEPRMRPTLLYIHTYRIITRIFFEHFNNVQISARKTREIDNFPITGLRSRCRTACSFPRILDITSFNCIYDTFARPLPYILHSVITYVETTCPYAAPAVGQRLVDLRLLSRICCPDRPAHY